MAISKILSLLIFLLSFHPHPAYRFVPSLLTPAITQQYLNNLYTTSNTRIRCPFFKRRASDLIDSCAETLRFLQLRHKTILPPGSLLSYDNTPKLLHPSLSEIEATLKQDFTINSYYTSGDLTTNIYSDACVFDGPDPDMPVTGLNKYVQSTKGLFDSDRSSCRLIELRSDIESNTITALWEADFVLRLPWRPAIRTIRGETIYHLDELNNLIVKHEESWLNLNVMDAFVSMLNK